MAVTLAQARTEVRALLDEQTAQFWTDAQLNSWINQACQDIARQAQNLWMTDVVTAVVNQQNYACPADFLGVHRLEYSPTASDQTYYLEFRGINTMDEIWGILHQLPAAYPQAFYLWNNTAGPASQMYFGVYPVIAAAGTFNLYYYREAVPAATDGANIDVTPGYEDIAYEYCVAKAKRKDRDPTWQEAMGFYTDQLMKMKDRTARFSDQGDQFTSGQPTWPIYAYSDATDW